ncbi:hypothetical protein Mal4_39220 [Maioricimonas rarisocia]|uniref:WD domain, G-beta repeat n=1 Tax=Maioricimonas rarisocia TaxID=2528026 RepID=A0A517ZAU8_9PLAN|nr:hypothetical protein [Maioricimonas rarisocia]QDU39577.1 hypothetical protein Mal4_39220 [Maioricimonas rarisocia]
MDPGSGKIWRSTLTGLDATIEAGKPENPRQRAKKFKSTDQAFEYLEKEEWKKLKTGYVLRDPDAQPGAPLLRTYLGGGYTGALPLTQSNNGLFTTRFEQSTDSVLKLAPSGQMEVVAELPEQTLVLDMSYSQELGRLLLNVDHSILSWHPETPKKCDAITDGKGAPASCLSVGGSRLVFFDPPNLVVQDGQADEQVFKTECKPESYGGHAPQLCAALSPDGSVLAVCSKPGALSFFRIDDGKELGEIQADFNMIEKLEFDITGDLLIGLGECVPWGPLFFDVPSMSLVEPPIELPRLREGGMDFALHPDRRWFAVTSWDQVFVFDLNKTQVVATIHLEHLAKRSGVHFVGDQLAVRTDLGCLSLYRIQ